MHTVDDPVSSDSSDDENRHVSSTSQSEFNGAGASAGSVGGVRSNAGAFSSAASSSPAISSAASGGASRSRQRLEGN